MPPPSWRVTPRTFFYLSNLVYPLFFVNLPTTFVLRVSPPWRMSPGAVYPLVTPLSFLPLFLLSFLLVLPSPAKRTAAESSRIRGSGGALEVTTAGCRVQKHFSCSLIPRNVSGVDDFRSFCRTTMRKWAKKTGAAKRVLQSLDFTVNRVLMKLFKSSNTVVISAGISFISNCRLYSSRDVLIIFLQMLLIKFIST